MDCILKKVFPSPKIMVFNVAFPLRHEPNDFQVLARHLEGMAKNVL